jgi:hypothetical protein
MVGKTLLGTLEASTTDTFTGEIDFDDSHTSP